MARLLFPSPLLRVVLLSVALVPPALAQSPLMPLSEIRKGMHGVGKTVFLGDRIEDFQVEILGVLENVGPKQSLILARCSGGPLAQTGVMQGMSGSPVYIEGKLIGALALAFPFSKEAIAGIRPIEEMLQVSQTPPPRPVPVTTDLLAGLAKPQSAGNMVEIATPLSFGGFTRDAIDQFAPRLRALGLEPRQGMGMGGKVDNRMGNPAALHPGSMISVELMTGDLTVGADGTLTYIDGEKVYAFGHRFLSVGPTGIPFTRSEVLALLPNLNSSFKISAPKELMGVISQDRNTAITGTLGRRASLIPVEIAMSHAGRPRDTYRMQMVNDRYLSPMLLQMAVFSSIDATERATGSSTLAVRGSIEFEGKRLPVPLDNVYAGEGGMPLIASLSAAIPLAYILQSGFGDLRVKRVALQIDSSDEKRILQIEDVSASRREVRPGDTVEITTLLTGENGVETARTVKYPVPVGAAPGTLFFSVADGTQTSFAELRASYGTNPRTADQLISTVNRLRATNKAYVRVWRADPAFQIAGEDFSNSPPSLTLMFAGGSSVQQVKNSKIAEFEIDAGQMMVIGSKTVQVEVRN